MAESRFSYLFRRYYTSEATPEEVRELQGIIKTGQYDREMAAVMAALWQEIPLEETFFQPETGQKILDHILYPAPANKVRSIPWYTRVAAIAAILLLIATGGYYYFENNRKTNEVTRPVAIKDIAPGHQGAVLTLSTGKQIVLDSSGNGVLAKDGQMDVIREKGQLKYEGPGNEAVYNTVTTGRGREWSVELPDHSKVWLNASSSIRYPLSFTGKERLVEITGEAYFEVVHNSNQPFKVKAGDKIIEDIGTKFNVNSYTDEPAMVTTVLEGAVSLQSNGHSSQLLKGQEGVVGAGASLIQVRKATGSDAIAWKNRYFKYSEPTGMQTVMRQLSRWYDIDIQYPGGVPQELFWGGIQRDLPLSSVLTILEKSNVKFKVEGRTLLVFR